MTRSKKPTQRRRASKPSPKPRDWPSDDDESPWEPYCVGATAEATEHLATLAQEALDENERAYWTAVSELSLAHEAEDRALAMS